MRNSAVFQYSRSWYQPVVRLAAGHGGKGDQRVASALKLRSTGGSPPWKSRVSSAFIGVLWEFDENFLRCCFVLGFFSIFRHTHMTSSPVVCHGMFRRAIVKRRLVTVAPHKCAWRRTGQRGFPAEISIRDRDIYT